MMRLIVTAAISVGMVALSPAAPSYDGLAAQQAGAATKRVAKQGEVSRSAFQGGQARTDFSPHPATQDPSRVVTQADLTSWVQTLSNWGRWGADDQRGTLNLITPEKQVEAARLVRTGRVATLASFLGLNKFQKAVDTWTDVPAKWWPISITAAGGVSANDAISFGIHDGIVTHMTALCHYGGLRADPSRIPEYGPWGAAGPNYPHQNSVFYNGYPYYVSEAGCQTLGIDRMGLEYTSRGVLYDLPQLKGVDWLDPTTPIFIEDLEEWERVAGVRAGSGDVMIIRTGRYAQRAAEGPWRHDLGGAGLHASVLPWLKQRNIGLLVSDGMNDVQPSGVQGSPMPIHQMSLVILGLPLVNNSYVEDAAAIARELRRWEFMVTWKNLHIPNATASPWNAVAIF